MEPDERGLPPPRVRGVEDVDARELDGGDRGRDGAPEDEPAEQDREVLRPADEQRHDGHEERVLDELEVGDHVVVEERVVGRRRSHDLEREPEQEEHARDPDGASRAQPLDAVPRDEPRSRRGNPPFY